jgi:hypothetical protein
MINMTETPLSPKAIAVLEAQGWNGSVRDIESDLADLQYAGFNSPPSYVLSLLEKYSAIEFQTISTYQDSRLVVGFGLDKVFEIPCVKSDVAEHEIILRKKLYPIGSIDTFELDGNRYFGRLILLISDDSAVYSSMSYVINQVGYDVNDFINRVVDDQLLWTTNADLKISYSRNDPRLKEFRKTELLEKKRR